MHELEIVPERPVCIKCHKHKARKGSALCGWCWRKTGPEETPESATKKEPKEKEIDLTAVTVSSRDKTRKISIAFDLDIQISNVRINGSWPDPEPESDEK